jgi:histone-lysine N-methyltransferase SETMAR
LKSSKKIILLHENIRQHMADLTMAAVGTVGWEMVNHPSYSPDLAPSDLHLFGPMKVHLGEQKFRTDDELMQYQELAVQSG